ncbi:hypothetical protein ON010_g7262 [Phytophthora cinnamomi]|nr:hypothetical protein ON010_g7262 [Phytophthora cinnamomi]
MKLRGSSRLDAQQLHFRWMRRLDARGDRKEIERGQHNVESRAELSTADESAMEDRARRGRSRTAECKAPAAGSPAST